METRKLVIGSSKKGTYVSILKSKKRFYQGIRVGFGCMLRTCKDP